MRTSNRRPAGVTERESSSEDVEAKDLTNPRGKRAKARYRLHCQVQEKSETAKRNTANNFRKMTTDESKKKGTTVEALSKAIATLGMLA